MNIVDSQIRTFAAFLNLSYDTILPLLEERSYTTNSQSINDWIQCNWEVLIEKKLLALNEFLEVYGEGADLYGKSSRINDIDALPTHKIEMKSLDDNLVFDWLNKTTVDVRMINFEEFVSFENGWYTVRPPFKYVLARNEETNVECVLSLDDIIFSIEKVK